MLQVTVDWLVYTVLGLNPAERFAQAVHFFIYDTIKIIVLLFVMITAIGLLRTYIPQERVKSWLSGKRKGLGNVMASLFGSMTPFCSCSSIPIFLGFLEAGVPLGVTFSFLITSPLVNEYLVILMFGFFGWKIAVAYILSGVFIGIVAGIILGTMNLENHLVEDLISSNSKINLEVRYNSLRDRLNFGLGESMSIIKKLWLWIIVGVGLGAAIHNYVPDEVLHGLISRGGIFAVPIATVLGVPIYGSCAAVVPIAAVLFQKGVPLGTALAFMMATAALSLPEAVMLRRAMKLRLIIIFFAVTTAGIIFTGYLFNTLQTMLVY